MLNAYNFFCDDLARLKKYAANYYYPSEVYKSIDGGFEQLAASIRNMATQMVKENSLNALNSFQGSVDSYSEKRKALAKILVDFRICA